MHTNHTAARPLVPTVAVLALLAGASLASPLPARAAQAQASIPPVYMHMVSAMASARSYKMVIDSASTGGLVMHMEWVSLHRGKLAQKYITIETKSGARRSIAQLVFTGTHVCYRQARVGA